MDNAKILCPNREGKKSGGTKRVYGGGTKRVHFFVDD